MENFIKQLILLFSLLCFKALATTPVFQNFSEQYGLQDNHIKTITEDNYGYIWMGTDTGVYQFDGYRIKKIDKLTQNKNTIIRKLLFDHKNRLLVATKNNGLLLFENNQVITIKNAQNNLVNVTDIIMDDKKTLWVSSDQGIFTISRKNTLVRPQLNSINHLKQSNISNIEELKPGYLIASTYGGFYLLNLINDSIKWIELKNNDYIHDIHASSFQDIWLASASELYHYNIQENTFVDVPELPNSTRYLSLTQHKHHLWVATIDGGLYRINTLKNSASQFTHDNLYAHSLAEKNILSVFVSSQDQLWIGGFNYGLSMLDLNSINFGYETYAQDSLFCTQTHNIISINTEDDGSLWLGNEYGLFTYYPEKNLCEAIDIRINENDTPYTVYSTRSEGNVMWISSSNGLLHLNTSNHTVTKLSDDSQFKTSFFSTLLSNNNTLIGTDKGIYELSRNTNKFVAYSLNTENSRQKSFLKFAKNSKNQIFLPTTSGLLMLDEQNQLNKFPSQNNIIDDKEIIAIHINALDEFFIGVYQQGIYHLSPDGKLLRHYFDQYAFSASNLIYQIQSNNPHELWMSGKLGIVYLNTETHHHQLYIGLEGHNYLSGLLRSSHNDNHTLYFAGTSGLIAFDPSTIKKSNQNTQVMIDQLYLANQPIESHDKPFDDFILTQDIENTSRLDFSHRQKIIGFDFTTLNFKNANHIKYAYKLHPTFDHWVTLLPGSRNLTFTNLASGNYILSIKATDSNQKWSNDITDIQLNILPAPWYTWWAYLIYCLLIILFLYLLFQYKITQQKKINAYLNEQVAEQTKHIKKQKETVEQLMERRNEIFSNVTHEFRTPITLIQGPVCELEKAIDDEHNLKMISMIKRNSNRLLRLVNQMLSFSQIIEKTSEQKHIIDASSQLRLIIEPYKYIAKEQQKKLVVHEIEDVKLFVTNEALEIIIGNLLSNAIKYSKTKGKINIGTQIIKDHLEIYIEDQGQGLDDEQKQNIFKRFNRLSRHNKIQGAGIGLTLVKEITELNDGKIKVSSVINHGSRFSVLLPLHYCVSQLSNQITSNEISKLSIDENKNKATVLIIEDNDDMRHYIETVLSENFNCLIANQGREGIAMAIQNVPDIIISDVMMPGIDGFHVCRIIRNEMITSHIPLVLLTALNNKSHRIKGWREKIDMYVSKPFDADELNIQLINILNIRKLLNQNNNTLVNNENYSEFNEHDQKFIYSLQSIFHEHYMLSSFGLENIAQLIFMSERQLQRKTKAIFNLSPLDMLREYRFNKATDLLKKGYQVSIVSDKCGFSSLSYFSQSFKNRYGMTPKKYQKTY